MLAPLTLLAVAAVAAPVPVPPVEPLPPCAFARLWTTRFRLPDGLARVTPSPGGRWLVTLSPDYSGSGLPLVVTVLDARTGLRAGGVTIRDGGWLRSQPAVSGDGRRVAVVGLDFDRLQKQHAERWLPPGQRDPTPVTELRCYDLATGRVAWQVPAEENARAAARPGGTGLAYCSANRVTVADSASGKSAASWECPGGWVWGLAWAADGAELVTVGADRMARVWDPKTGRQLRSVSDAVADEHPDDRPRVGESPRPQPTGGLGGWGISPDGRWLAAADGAAVRVLDLTTGKVARTEQYPDAVFEVAVSADGRTIATRHRDPDTVRLRNTRLGKTWELYAWMKGYPARTRTYPTFTADGRTLLAPWARVVRAWDADTGEETTPAAGFHHTYEEVRFSPDGSQVRTGTRHNEGIDDLWDARTGRHLKRERHDYAAFRGPPGSWLGVRYIPGRGEVVELYRTDTKESVRELPGQVRWLGGSGFSLDGGRVFAQGGGRTLVWEVATGQLLLNREGKSPFNSSAVRFVGDAGRWLAVSDGGALTVIDLTTKAERVLAKDVSDVFGAGDFLVAVASERGASKYRVWNLDTGAEVAAPLEPVRGESGVMFTALYFSPDGKAVARVLGDGRSVAVHDWPSGTLRRTLAGTARVERVAFSPDGRRLATTLRDTTTLIWDVGPPDPPSK